MCGSVIYSRLEHLQQNRTKKEHFHMPMKCVEGINCYRLYVAPFCCPFGHTQHELDIASQRQSSMENVLDDYLKDTGMI